MAHGCKSMIIVCMDYRMVVPVNKYLEKKEILGEERNTWRLRSY
jgi:hypothetical protein